MPTSSCSATRTGAVPPTASREASDPRDRQDRAHVGRQVLADAREVVVRQIPQLDAARLALAHARTGDLVRDAEGHALAHEPLGDVGREREALRGASDSSRSVSKVSVLDHAGERRQQHLEGVDRVEHRLLVLLEVAVVGERQSLERRQQAGEVTDETTRLAARAARRRRGSSSAA